MHTHLNEDSSDGSSDGCLYPQEQVYLNEDSSDGSSAVVYILRNRFITAFTPRV